MKSPIQRDAESKLRTAIAAVEKLMPSGIGIALFVFERNTDKGNIGYIANARREDMRRALTEFLRKWESDAPGQPFYPLTLEAFEAWVEHSENSLLGCSVRNALAVYHQLSNAGPTNATEVTQQ